MPIYPSAQCPCSQPGHICICARARACTIAQVYVYSAARADSEGELVESDEMRPQWFGFEEVPLGEMWADDQYWLPHLLAGHDVLGEFVLADKSTLVEHDVEVLPSGQFALSPVPAATGLAGAGAAP